MYIYNQCSVFLHFLLNTRLDRSNDPLIRTFLAWAGCVWMFQCTIHTIRDIQRFSNVLAWVGFNVSMCRPGWVSNWKLEIIETFNVSIFQPGWALIFLSWVVFNVSIMFQPGWVLSTSPSVTESAPSLSPSAGDPHLAKRCNIQFWTFSITIPSPRHVTICSDHHESPLKSWLQSLPNNITCASPQAA